MSINYKFREGELIDEFKAYIDSTYSGHYGQGGLQSSEVIVDRGRGLDFFLGNVDKYNCRYGKKGTSADHRKDLMKVLHYALLALYEHDRINNSGYTNGGDYKVSNFDELTYGEVQTARKLADATPQEWNAANLNYDKVTYNYESK